MDHIYIGFLCWFLFILRRISESLDYNQQKAVGMIHLYKKVDQMTFLGFFTTYMIANRITFSDWFGVLIFKDLLYVMCEYKLLDYIFHIVPKAL